MFETHQVTLEVYIGDALVNQQSIQAPKEILMANFIQVVNQIGNDKRPMKVLMTRPEVIWDRFEQEHKTINREISFNNNAMISYEEDKYNNGRS